MKIFHSKRFLIVFAVVLVGGVGVLISQNLTQNQICLKNDIMECFGLGKKGSTEYGAKIDKIERKKIHGKYYTFENLSGDNIFVSAKTEAEFYSFVCAAAQGNKFAHIDCTKIAGNQFQFPNGRCQREPSESDLAKEKCGNGNPTMRSQYNSNRLLDPLPVLFTTCNHWNSGFDYCFPLEF